MVDDPLDEAHSDNGLPSPKLSEHPLPMDVPHFLQPACQLVTTVNGSGPRASADDCTTRMEKRLTHPERGEMTFRTVIETMGGHDLNHLKPLETAAA